MRAKICVCIYIYKHIKSRLFSLSFFKDIPYRATEVGIYDHQYIYIYGHIFIYTRIQTKAGLNFNFENFADRNLKIFSF